MTRLLLPALLLTAACHRNRDQVVTLLDAEPVTITNVFLNFFFASSSIPESVSTPVQSMPFSLPRICISFPEPVPISNNFPFVPSSLITGLRKERYQGASCIVEKFFENFIFIYVI